MASLKPENTSMSLFFMLLLPAAMLQRALRTLSSVNICQSLSCVHRSSRWIGELEGLRAARRHSVTISSHRLQAACWPGDVTFWPPRPWLLPLLWMEEILVTNHHSRIWKIYTGCYVNEARQFSLLSSRQGFIFGSRRDAWQPRWPTE